jgi:hypothetical protein
MLPDDTFRAYLERTTAALTAWRGFVADVATCTVAVEGRNVRLDLAPKTKFACPVELVLYATQRYDIAIADEIYEDLVLNGKEEFVPLLTAITEGQVLTRTEFSALTSRPVGVETIVTMPAGRVWQRSRQIAPVEADTICRDHHYLPYRRI